MMLQPITSFAHFLNVILELFLRIGSVFIVWIGIRHIKQDAKLSHANKYWLLLYVFILLTKIIDSVFLTAH